MILICLVGVKEVLLLVLVVLTLGLLPFLPVSGRDPPFSLTLRLGISPPCILGGEDAFLSWLVGVFGTVFLGINLPMPVIRSGALF